ncbi:MAG: cytochrome B, partial [Saprospiraceae bacterium]|nr:cytochrome B [Saprospiraceae bacterium]
LMKDRVMRFFAVEHPMMMLIAIILITVGYIKGKKQNSFKPIFWYYLIALLLILAGIPWPFMKSFASGWF